MENDVPPVIHM